MFLLLLVYGHVGLFVLFVQVEGLGWFCSACLEPMPVNYKTSFGVMLFLFLLPSGAF